MLIESLLAWVWVPALLVVLSFGAGLLVERVARFPMPAGLLAPVGFAVLVLLATGGFQLGASAPVVLGLLVAVAAAGLVIEPRSLRQRVRIGWAAGGAAGLTFGLYLAPIVLSGQWTWSGYNFVNDTALHLLLTEHILENGPVQAGGPETTASELIRFNLNDRYPFGPHALLASLHLLSGTPLEAAYQPFLATLAALAAMALGTLARLLGLRPLLAAALATVSLAANLVYQQALQGAIKEVGVVLLVCAAGTVAWMVAGSREERAPHVVVGGFAVLVLCLVAAIPVYTVAGGAYLAAFTLIAGAAWLVPRLRGENRIRISKRRVALIALLPVLALPLLPGVLEFSSGTLDDFAAEGGSRTAFLGNLLHPLEIWQVAGIWFHEDYRKSVPDGIAWLNYAAIGALLAFFAVGVFSQLRQRLGALLFALPLLVVLAAAAPFLSPYVDSKLLAIASPGVVFVAGLGTLGIIRRAPAVLSVATALLAGSLAVAVIASDALAYRAVRLAPVERLDSLREAARHLEGGPWLLNEWEEFAKYYMSNTQVNVANEDYSPRPAEYRDRSLPLFGYYYDLDQFDTEYLQDFPGIVFRRSPSASRPPAGFRKAYENDLYEVWVREDRGLNVVEHLTSGDVLRAAGVPGCRSVRQIASRLGPGERLLAAIRPEIEVMDLAARVPRSWRRSNSQALTWVPEGPAFIEQPIRLEGGRYRVWIRGSFGRPVTAVVDGRRIGTAEGLNSPGQWIEVGSVDLQRGGHDVGLLRGGGRLAPGDGVEGLVGPVALEKVGRQRIIQVDPGDADSLCRRAVDWIERVR